MRLTREAEIAIGLLAACARAEGGWIRTRTAASAIGTTYSHAAKVVHMLTAAGFLATARGRRGGLGLARPADAIPLAAVLRHVQPDLLARADDGTRGRPAPLARLDALVGTARAAFGALMQHVTVADLVAEAEARRPACLDCRHIHAIPHPRTERSDPHALHPHG